MNDSRAPSPQKAQLVDLLGAGISGLCLIHCVILPFVVAAIPAFSLFNDNEDVHRLLVLLAVPVTFWLIAAARREKDFLTTLIPAVAGLGLLIAPTSVESLEPYEVLLTTLGACLLTGTHLRRWIRYRCGRVALRAHAGA